MIEFALALLLWRFWPADGFGALESFWVASVFLIDCW
jgi:hypothetical protein